MVGRKNQNIIKVNLFFPLDDATICKIFVVASVN